MNLGAIWRHHSPQSFTSLLFDHQDGHSEVTPGACANTGAESMALVATEWEVSQSSDKMTCWAVAVTEARLAGPRVVFLHREKKRRKKWNCSKTWTKSHAPTQSAPARCSIAHALRLMNLCTHNGVRWIRWISPFDAGNNRKAAEHNKERSLSYTSDYVIPPYRHPPLVRIFPPLGD